MKKLYTTLLAACTLFAASAALPQPTEATLTAEQATLTGAKLTKVRTFQSMEISAELSKANNDGPKRIGIRGGTTTGDYTWESIGTGKYASSVVADTYGASNEPVEVEIFEAKEKAGVYKAVGVWPDFTEDESGYEFIVDASDPEFVTVAKQFTGIVDPTDGDTYIASQTWILSQNYDKELIIEAVPDLVPTVKNGCIYFPAKALVLNWPEAPEGGQYGTDPTKWYVGKSSGYLLLPGGEYVDPWINLGEGTFSGDFFFGTFGATPADYKVNVYKSSEANIYRVEDALKGLYAALGFKGTSPTFEFDATDVDNISLPLTSTGITSKTDGAYLAVSDNQIYDTIEECPEETRITLTKEGTTATITFPAGSLGLYAQTSQKLYYGNEEVAAFLTFTEPETSGLGSIEAVDNNAPVEYFNLQGQRVANPTAGQLMIKRQGTKVTKVIVK